MSSLMADHRIVHFMEREKTLQVHNTMDCVIGSFEVSNHFFVRSSETDKQGYRKTDSIQWRHLGLEPVYVVIVNYFEASSQTQNASDNLPFISKVSDK